jgi:hypothetical protein
MAENQSKWADALVPSPQIDEARSPSAGLYKFRGNFRAYQNRNSSTQGPYSYESMQINADEYKKSNKAKLGNKFRPPECESSGCRLHKRLKEERCATHIDGANGSQEINIQKRPTIYR